MKTTIEDLKEDDPRAGWRLLMGKLKGKKKAKGISRVLNEDGEEVDTKEARKVVAETYRRLGVHDPEDTDFQVSFEKAIKKAVRRHEAESIYQDVLDKGITQEEVKHVTKRIQNGKASGSDEILGEWLKAGGEHMSRALWIILNNAWLRESTPTEWATGIIHPIYKGGDVSHFRGITLLSVAGKVFAGIVKDRLNAFLESNKLLYDEQGGFRKQRGCREQIFILNEVIQSRKIKKLTTFC